jgi:peptidoglycan/LPS O-acetylase OafA/YrhL
MASFTLRSPTAAKHDPALDGIRAFAALFVLLAHSAVPGFPGGARGVDVFFVLSGFLITRILRERQDSYLDFLQRRARRLLPALVLMIAVTLPVLLALRPSAAPAAWREAILAVTYTTNLARNFETGYGPYFHAWSLAVEMQFYLLWPFVVPLLARSKRPAAWLLGAWVVLTAARSAPGLPPGMVYHNLHQSGLILGAAVAFLPAAKARWSLVGCCLIGLGVGTRLGGIPGAEIGSALLISGLQRPNLLRPLLGWRPLVRLGELSYGIYLWHWPVIHLSGDSHWGVKLGLSLAVATAMAAVSYYLIEIRIRRPRPRSEPVAEEDNPMKAAA